MTSARAVLFSLLAALSGLQAEVLPLPPRPADAPDGTQLIRILERMPLEQREAWIWNELLRGNVPAWNRTFVEVPFADLFSGTNYTVVFKALPDYLALGSDTNYFLTPMTPLLAQRLADKLGCVLPTRKLVNIIWTNAQVKLDPQPITPTAQMTTVPVFADHNQMVRQQRDQYTNSRPLGALVSGDKKDVVISARIYTNFATSVRHPVVIYGWHYISGAPIQPLYNGHEETYADYSHGIRLLHGTVLINGQPLQITNVLKDPALARLLNDETVLEGAGTNGALAIPRYSPAGVAPSLIRQPRSSSLRPGQVLRLGAAASGDEPLAWSWQHDGAPLDEHGSDVVISNVPVSASGLWTVTVSNLYGRSTSRPAVVRVRAPQYPVVLSDDFEGASVRWRLRWGAANAIADYSADMNFDHGFEPTMINGLTELVPPAPNSDEGKASAARLAVNSLDGLGAVCAVNAYSEAAFSNDFALKFDCWMNYPGGAGGINSTGSTQHAIFGINHSGAFPSWSGATPSDGLWFAMSGEGGDVRDYRAYQGSPTAALELTGPNSGLTASNNVAPLFQGLFPSSRFETPGAPGKQWVEVELCCSNNVVSWICDGVAIATRTNTSAFCSGSVMFGLSDMFASIANPARDSYLLVDNVRVEDLSGRTRILEGNWIANMFKMVFSAVPGRQYEVSCSEDLAHWTRLASLESKSGPLEFTETAPAEGRKFYRVAGPLP